MHFYGPLLSAAFGLTKDWMTAYSIISKTIFAGISPLVSVAVFEYFLSPKRDERRPLEIRRILRIGAEAVAGPLVIVFAVFIFELFYSAPEIVLRQVSLNPPIEVCESKIIPIFRAFKDVCRIGKVRILSPPQRYSLHGDLRNIAQIQGCAIANDADDLNRAPDIDSKAIPSASPGPIPNITLRADAEHHPAADEVMTALSSVGLFHFDYGSSLPPGTEPGTAVVIELPEQSLPP